MSQRCYDIMIKTEERERERDALFDYIPGKQTFANLLDSIFNLSGGAAEDVTFS